MIGIFDSGLGGLTVARAIMQALPDQKIIYLGDTARGPYGNRPAREVIEFAIENTQFLLDKKVQTVVVGCNTASAVAGQHLLKHFPGVTVLEVITPAVREALRVSNRGRIGIIGTRTTINSGAYQHWIKSVTVVPCPLFVPLVEGGAIESEATNEIMRHYFKELKRNKIDTLILGCTHYPFLKPMIEKIMGPRVRLIDSAQTVAREVSLLLKYENIKILKQKHVPNHEFYVTKKTGKFQELAEKWLGTKIELKLAKI